MFYFDLDQRFLHENTIGIFSKNLNVTLESCLDHSISKQLEINLNSLEIKENYSENWIPVYIDNQSWNQIEFVCHIYVDYPILFNGENNEEKFQFVSIQ